MILAKTYVISVQTGEELTICNRINREMYNIKASVPTNKIEIRKNGNWIETQKVFIPGYVFVTGSMNPGVYYRIKKMPFVKNWLGNGEPVYLNEADDKFIRVISNGGFPIPIQTKESELFKNAVKTIDKRQRRMRVTISLFDKIHTLTLGYK